MTQPHRNEIDMHLKLLKTSSSGSKVSCVQLMLRFQYEENQIRTAHYLLATVKTASVAALALSFSPKVMIGLKANGFSNDVNLLSDTTSESIT